MQAQEKSQQPHILQKSVVVFSKNYMPLTRINIRRAVVLLITGQAESMLLSNTKQWEVRSPSVVLQIPEHIRLMNGNPQRNWKIPPVNRHEVLRRDNHTCQYCGSIKHLTIDHLIPRSKGGSHSWDNVVTACSKCNSIKGNRLLHETGMTLKSKPKAPIHPAIAFAEQFWKEQ